MPMPLDDTIIVALISGLCVAIPSIIATSSQNRKNSELINYQIGELSKKTDEIGRKVDGIWERVLQLEGRMTAAEKQLEDVKEKKDE